jgi:hypothetical protein
LKLAVFRETVVHYARELIKDTRYEAYYLNENGYHSKRKWQHFYYDHFLGADDETSSGSQRPLDVRRARWGTAENMKVHYDNLVDALIRARIARPNPQYDADDKDECGIPKEPEVLFDYTRLNRLVSMDETRINKSTTGDGGARKGRTERIVRSGKDDDGECLGQKAPGNSFSGVGGSNAAFEGLRALFVLSSETLDVEALLDHLPATVLMGKTVHGEVDCNTKGAMTGELMIKYLKTCIEPYVGEPVSKENPAVFVCDGVGVHMTLEFLEHMIESGWLLVLRTPYCSEKQQNEDLLSFWALKNGAETGIYRAKSEKLGHVFVASGGKRQELTDVELLDCAKPAWESAFSRTNNETAWRMAGLVPFTRAPYWRQLAKEQKAVRIVSSLGTDLNVSALQLPGLCGKRSADGAADGDDEDGEADGDDEDGAQCGRAKLTATDLAMLPGGAMSEEGINLARLKGVNGVIKKFKAPQLKELLAQKDIAYKNADQAMLEIMNIEAISFGRSHMPLSWLPASLKALQQQKLGMTADVADGADGEEATAPAAKKQKQAAARFEFGAAKAAADRLIAASAGVGAAGDRGGDGVVAAVQRETAENLPLGRGGDARQAE